MPLKLAFGVGETVTGHRLDAPEAQCARRYWRLIDGTEIFATGLVRCFLHLLRRPTTVVG